MLVYYMCAEVPSTSTFFFIYVVDNFFFLFFLSVHWSLCCWEREKKISMDKNRMWHCKLLLFMLDKITAAEAKLIDKSYEDSLVGSTVLWMVCNVHESWIWLGRQKPHSGRPQEFGNHDLKTFWMLTPFSIGIGWKTWYWLLKSCKILVKYGKDSKSREMSSTWIVREKHWIT